MLRYATLRHKPEYVVILNTLQYCCSMWMAHRLAAPRLNACHMYIASKIIPLLGIVLGSSSSPPLLGLA
eukprot:9479567-Pyramimonas_sp.AAC.1